MKTDYQIQLPSFEGPFDLLLHLIKENQVDIWDIPIAEISQQYLDYVRAMEELDLEIASSFLVMAATLLAIKARMLLPLPPAEEGEEEPEDARAGLVRDLLDYMRFKEAARGMEQLYLASSKRIPRPNQQELYLNLFSRENPLSGKTLADLQQAFDRVLAKAAAQGQTLDIRREQVTLRDRLEYLWQMMRSNRQGLAFSALFAGIAGRMELVVTFLALLELVRQQVILVDQGRQYGEIYLFPGEKDAYEPDAAI